MFLNQERSFRQFAILVVEDTDSAFARTGQILVAQVLHDIDEHRIVKALSQPMVEADIQAGINALEGSARDLHEFVPQRGIGLVSLLQFGQLFARPICQGRIRCGLGLDLFVDALHFGQGVLLIRRPVKKRTIADNQHAELGAPVAQMIVRLHRVAAKTQHPAERVAQDGGTNMTDVHGFGHVGGAEVDDDGFRAGGRVNPQVVVLGDGQQGLPQPVRVKTEIDKARPGNLPACRNLVRVEPRHNGLGQLAGILFAGLGHRHDAVGLIVAEFRVGRGFDYRRGGRPAGGLNGLCRLFFQELLYCWHTLTCAMIFENNLPPGIQSRRLERTKRRTVACGESEQGWNAERTRRRPRPAGETG